MIREMAQSERSFHSKNRGQNDAITNTLPLQTPCEKKKLN